MTVGYLSIEQVRALHADQLRLYGGATGLRDKGAHESAVARPAMTFGGEDLYEDLASKASALMHSLVLNHAFVDGNKRIAFMTMVAFLRKNGVRFSPDQAHITAIILSLAAGEVSEESLARWIRDNWPKSSRVGR